MRAHILFQSSVGINSIINLTSQIDHIMTTTFNYEFKTFLKLNLISDEEGEKPLVKV